MKPPSPRFSRPLVRHPESPALGVCGITSAAGWSKDGALVLTYTLAGPLEGLRVPVASQPRRQDGLWRHTCCEVFVRAAQDVAYREFNFSPAGAWQAYAFSAYRLGGELAVETPPGIACTAEGARLTLTATVPPGLLPAGDLRLALAMVVEGADGRIAYWALAHPVPKPDFHHTDAFVLSLPRS